MMQYKPSVTMRAKNFVSCEHSEKLWQERDKVSHRVDGLIMHAAASSYRFGTAHDGSVFKWKEFPTVDLAGPQHQAGNGEPLPSNAVQRRVVVDSASRIVPSCSTDVIEYLVTISRNKIHLFGIRRRPDKTRGNSMQTILATFSDAAENIRVSELSASKGLKRDLE